MAVLLCDMSRICWRLLNNVRVIAVLLRAADDSKYVTSGMFIPKHAEGDWLLTDDIWSVLSSDMAHMKPPRAEGVLATLLGMDSNRHSVVLGYVSPISLS